MVMASEATALYYFFDIYSLMMNIKIQIQAKQLQYFPKEYFYGRKMYELKK